VVDSMPKGEKLRRAVRWISERRREEGQASAGVLVGDAALRFDLSPRESEFLLELLRQPPETDADVEGS